MCHSKKRLIDANALPYENQVLSYDDEWCLKVSDIENAPHRGCRGSGAV